MGSVLSVSNRKRFDGCCKQAITLKCPAQDQMSVMEIFRQPLLSVTLN